MASRRPCRDMPSVYERDCPILRREGSLSGAASAGGDERRTRGSRRMRQRSPPSTHDEVLEEEHVTAAASSSSEDERVSRRARETRRSRAREARRSRVREARRSRARERVPLPGLSMSEVPRASLRFRFLTTAQCRRNMVGSLPRGMPKVVDYRQTDAQAPNKTVTQDRHEVLSQEGVIPTSCI